MRHRINALQPWVWATVSAAIAAVAVVGTVAEVARRKIRQIAALDPRAPFDPYYGMAEYTFSNEPVTRP